MTMKTNCLRVLIAAGLFLQASVANAGIVGLWEFNDGGNLGKATIGNDLALQNTNGTIAATSGISGIDGAASVGIGDYFTVTHGVAANGGGQYVNQYSIVYDVLSPAGSTGQWRTLLQTNQGNANDGDYFISTGADIGVFEIGYTTATIADDKWYRIVFSADVGQVISGAATGSFLTRIIDSSGAIVTTFEHNFQDLDGRHSLDPTALLFADNDGDDAMVRVTQIGFYDAPLTGAALDALGAPGTSLAVPEPGSLAVLTMVGLGLVLRRRK